MKTLRIAFVLAAAALSAAPALAQNAEPFTGLRGEIHLGYDAVSFDLEDAGLDGSLDEGGFLYGAGVGYDYDFGKFVLGLEANLDFSNVEFSASDGVDSASIETGRDIEVSARAGVKVSPMTLLYAKAGYSNARSKATVTEGGFTESGSGNGDGARVGAGLEHAFGEKTFAKLEYRYTNYDGPISRNQVVAAFGLRF